MTKTNPCEVLTAVLISGALLHNGKHGCTANVINCTWDETTVNGVLLTNIHKTLKCYNFSLGESLGPGLHLTSKVYDVYLTQNCSIINYIILVFHIPFHMHIVITS